MSDTPKSTSFRAFLDECQYSTRSILRYEQIFGPGYVSTGGFETTKVLPSRACQSTQPPYHGSCELLPGKQVS